MVERRTEAVQEGNGAQPRAGGCERAGGPVDACGVAVAFFRVRSVGRPVRASKRPGLSRRGRRRSQSILTALRGGGSEASAVLRSLAARHLAVHQPIVSMLWAGVCFSSLRLYQIGTLSHQSPRQETGGVIWFQSFLSSPVHGMGLRLLFHIDIRHHRIPIDSLRAW
jgi:hypothetical protein